MIGYADAVEIVIVETGDICARFTPAGALVGDIFDEASDVNTVFDRVRAELQLPLGSLLVRNGAPEADC